MSRALHERLERAPLPDAERARRRAWTLVRAAAPAERTRRRRRLPLLALLAAAAVTLALTPPGAAVGEWVRDRVDPPKRPAQPAAEPATRLPAVGRLLVRDSHGVAVVAQDGTRRGVGRFDGATWSPRGLFVAAWAGTRLSALTPAGDARWQISAPSRIRAAIWSPDGFRIAYVTAGGWLHIVAGDGSGDRILARTRSTIPAWRPDAPHTLALVSASGRIEARDVDTGKLIAGPGASAPAGARTLSWSSGGERVAAIAPREIRVFDLHHKRSARIAPPP
jgi:hypothetical protein